MIDGGALFHRPGAAWPTRTFGRARARRCGPIATLLLALAVGPTVAFAQDPPPASAPDVAAAKQKAGDGLLAYNAGQYDKALTLFSEARKAYPSAQVLRMIGYSELALQHWLKAADTLDEALVAELNPLSKEDRKDVEDNLAKATLHLGKLTLHCRGSGVKVSFDGGDPKSCTGDKTLRVAEGPHKLLATAPDRTDASADVVIAGGATAEVTLEPLFKQPAPVAPVAPSPPVAPPPPTHPARGRGIPYQRELGVGLMAGGALAGIGTLVTFIESVHWRNMANADVATHLQDYGQGCAMGDPRLCAYDVSVTNNEADTANTLRNATVGLGVTALVLGGAGVALLVTAPKSGAPIDTGRASSPIVGLRCGPGGISVVCSGSF